MGCLGKPIPLTPFPYLFLKGRGVSKGGGEAPSLKSLPSLKATSLMGRLRGASAPLSSPPPLL